MLNNQNHSSFSGSRNAYLNGMNPLNAARTRCMDIRYKWITEKQKEGRFQLEHVMGENIVADELTKPLEREKQNRFLRMFGLVEKRIP